VAYETTAVRGAPPVDGHVSITGQPGSDLALGAVHRQRAEVVAASVFVLPGDLAFDLGVGLAEGYLNRLMGLVHGRAVA
jgi:hypothetical protein